jgi:hypothetical protein
MTSQRLFAYLFALTLQYEPETKRMVVPVAGRMLYEDNRGSGATAPTTQPADKKFNLRGATAFEWQRDFIYDDEKRQATMSGDVDVVHRGTSVAGAAGAAGAAAAAGAANDNYRLHAQRVVAELMPSSDKSTTQPTEAKLKNLIADGGVTFNSANLQFIADRVEYDPQRQVLIARGTDRAPATLLDQNGLSQGTFAELIYDVKTDRMQMTDPRGTIRRSSGGSNALTGSNPDADK